MAENKGLLSGGFGMVTRNKRYIVWFYLLNLALAWLGLAAFRSQASTVLDHSLFSDRLMHGFDVGVFIELLSRPEFGPTNAASFSAVHFALLFFVFTAIFLPGVFQGYASTYRLPREDFFRACGRNLWRFIRLMIIAGIVMGIFAGILFALNGALVKSAGESTNEMLPFEVRIAGLTIIFLVMTVLRIWFDLAEADVVLNDQRAVRKSIGTAFRHTFRSLGRLLASYVVATILAIIFLAAGILAWMKLVPPESLVGAFLISQLTLLLLLIPRFWQRGIAVSYWQQRMLIPVVQEVPIAPLVPQPLPVVVAPDPEPLAPILPTPPVEPQP